MAKIEASTIQELLDRIDGLRKALEALGEDARKKLEPIKLDELLKALPLADDGRLDSGQWGNLDEGDQKRLYESLGQARDCLHAVATLDGPPDPKHVMYSEYASNLHIYLGTAFGFVLILVLLWQVFSHWNEATGTDYAPRIQVAAKALGELKAAEDEATRIDATLKAEELGRDALADSLVPREVHERIRALTDTAKSQSVVTADAARKAGASAVAAVKAIQEGGATESSVLMMVILLGALGGSLHLVGSLVKYVGNRQLKRSWLLYYAAMPFTGAGLAPVVYMLMRVGLLNPAGGSTDGSGVANLNLIALYGFAAMTGLFSRTALDKLGEVFRTLFRTAEAQSKDTLGAEKAGGGATSGTGTAP